jgi:predicted MFS family arabinose efflux permease
MESDPAKTAARWGSLFLPGGVVGASLVAGWLGDSPGFRWMVVPVAVCAAVATVWIWRRYEAGLQRSQRQRTSSLS